MAVTVGCMPAVVAAMFFVLEIFLEFGELFVLVVVAAVAVGIVVLFVVLFMAVACVAVSRHFRRDLGTLFSSEGFRCEYFGWSFPVCT